MEYLRLNGAIKSYVPRRLPLISTKYLKPYSRTNTYGNKYCMFTY